MLHPRSEVQIFATVDALCEKVGRHLKCTGLHIILALEFNCCLSSSRASGC